MNVSDPDYDEELYARWLAQEELDDSGLIDEDPAPDDDGPDFTLDYEGELIDEDPEPDALDAFDPPAEAYGEI